MRGARSHQRAAVAAAGGVAAAAGTLAVAAGVVRDRAATVTAMGAELPTPPAPGRFSNPMFCPQMYDAKGKLVPKA